MRSNKRTPRVRIRVCKYNSIRRRTNTITISTLSMPRVRLENSSNSNWKDKNKRIDLQIVSQIPQSSETTLRCGILQNNILYIIRYSDKYAKLSAVFGKTRMCHFQYCHYNAAVVPSIRVIFVNIRKLRYLLSNVFSIRSFVSKRMQVHLHHRQFFFFFFLLFSSNRFNESH